MSLTDATDVRAYEDKLKKAKEMAEIAHQAKTDFIAHMSHKIRTPLTAISGVAEILDGSRDGLDDKQKKLVDILVSSTASLKDMVGTILDFLKTENDTK